MANHAVAESRWNTRSHGSPEGAASVELDALRAHLMHCQRPYRSAFHLHGAAREVGSFLLARVISTLLISTLLLATLIQVL